MEKLVVRVQIGFATLLLSLCIFLCSGYSSSETKALEVNQSTDKAFQKYTETMPGSKVSFDMMPIPGGTYMEGSPKSEKDRNQDEGPQTKVEIKPFWMGKCEVTWDEYYVFADSTEHLPPEGEKGRLIRFKFKDRFGDEITKPTPPYMDMTFGYGRDGFPAINVSHFAAMEYCRWLSAKTGKDYRLPTEAEWEYACRAGTTTAYFFGDDPSQLGEYAWFSENSNEKPHLVGKKKPNPWGLYDMHGNVAEWCIDGYQADAYAKRDPNKVAVQPVNIMVHARFPNVVRGGSWVDEAKTLRSAARVASQRDWIRQDPQSPQSIWYLTDADFVGFRIVRAVQEQKELIGIKSKVTRQSPYKP
jgi:formylglycine-generating enzyme required for sulfatase activity